MADADQLSGEFVEGAGNHNVVLMEEPVADFLCRKAFRDQKGTDGRTAATS